MGRLVGVRSLPRDGGQRGGGGSQQGIWEIVLRGGSGFGAPPRVRLCRTTRASYQFSIRYSSLIVISPSQIY